MPLKSIILPLSHSRISMYLLTERNVIFWGGFWIYILANSSHFCAQGATLWCKNPLLSPNNFTLGHLLKTEWLVDDVHTCWVPWESGSWYFGDDFGRFLATSGRFCVRVTTLWSRNPLLSLNNFTEGHSMKIVWLVANVTVVGSPARAECNILWVILDVFLANQAAFICGEGVSLWCRNPLLSPNTFA